MTAPTEHSKDELMREMSRAWAELNSMLDNLSPEQLAMRDAEGWTAIDHVNHIAAWERSVVYFLQGKRRYEGLGIDKALFASGNDDAINAAVQKNTAALSPADALRSMRDTHRQLLETVEPMTDSEIKQTIGSFSSDKENEGDSRMLLGMIYVNTAQHYGEHTGWIKTLTRLA
jgi:hypothetical protein